MDLHLARRELMMRDHAAESNAGTVLVRVAPDAELAGYSANYFPDIRYPANCFPDIRYPA